MVVGKTKSNLVRSTRAENAYGAEEHAAGAGSVGSPLGSPAVQAVPRQAGIRWVDCSRHRLLCSSL